jgi:hypothetical protein
VKQNFRIALELIGPPLIGSFCVFLYQVIAQGLLPSGADVRFLVLVAFLYAGFPAILYTLAMETAIECGLGPRKVGLIFLSSGLGAFFGGGLIAIVGRGGAHLGDITYWSTIGFIVGFLIALILKYSEPKNSYNPPNQSMDPTPASVTPVAGQPPRQP